MYPRWPCDHQLGFQLQRKTLAHSQGNWRSPSENSGPAPPQCYWGLRQRAFGLGLKSLHFLARQGPGRVINRKDEFHRHLPCDQFLVRVAHRRPPTCFGTGIIRPCRNGERGRGTGSREQRTAVTRYAVCAPRRHPGRGSPCLPGARCLWRGRRLPNRRPAARPSG